MVVPILMTACADRPAPPANTADADSTTRSDTLRELVLRALAAHDKEPYFVAYCVAATPHEIPPQKTLEARVRTAWGIEGPDASQALLSQVGDLPHRFLPASDCMKTDGDYDVVVREGKRKPALFVGIGPIQAISRRKVEIVAFTTSGGLTETATAFSLERRPDGTWFVGKEEILLQV